MPFPAQFEANDADAWHALGMTLAARGDRAGAFSAFRNALRLDNGRADTHLALGNLLFDTGRLDEALRCFELAAAGRDFNYDPTHSKY
jgi:tetratricopeptide (TPR) repeat protein